MDQPKEEKTPSRLAEELATRDAAGQKKESWWDVVKFALITLIIILPIRIYIAQPFIVSGSSMVPTFHNGEYLIVDELSYRFHEPRRGDVVIFRYPKDPSKFFIKRVIGLPGDTITVTDGRVYVSSQDSSRVELAEPYLNQKTYKNTNVTLPPNQYFVMGDNRSVSYDSRYWGPLDKKFIRGRALVRLFPPSKLAVMPGAYESYGTTTQSTNR